MYRSVIIFILLLFSSFAGLTQSMLLRQANQLYDRMQYSPAIDYYESVLEIDTNSLEAKIKLANCFRLINDSKNAERLYEKIVRVSNIEPIYYLYYAEALNENGKHEKAKKWYDKYETLAENDDRGLRFKKGLDKLDQFYADTLKYKIHYLSVNSAQPDFAPVIFDSGLVFCSGRRNGLIFERVQGFNESPYLDLYYVKDTSEILEYPHKSPKKVDHYTPKKYGKNVDKKEPMNNYHDDDTYYTSNDSHTLGYKHGVSRHDTNSRESITEVKLFDASLNTKYHEGPATFDATGKTMLFTRSNYTWHAKKSEDGVTKLKIFQAENKGKNNWSNVEEFPFNSDEYSTGHPALSRDGNTLFFISDRPGGYGGTDIWYSVKQNDRWTAPKNVGNKINTEGNEMFPFIDPYNDLYFASDGHAGIGGLDIFKARNNGNWQYTQPHNLGYPLNTLKDDFGVFWASDKLGFFSSNRKRGSYDDDIYQVQQLKKDPLWIKGVIMEDSTRKPIVKAQVWLTLNNKVAGDTVMSIRGGKFIFNNLDYDKIYTATATAEYFDTASVSVSTKDTREGDTLYVEIRLKRLPILVSVKGTVYESDTKKPMNKMTVVLNDSKKNVIKKFITGTDGKYSFPLDTNGCYTISCAKVNCGLNTERITTYHIKKTQAIQLNLPMVCKGDIIVLDDIYYDFDKTEIRPDAAKVLDRTLLWFAKYPNMSVELSSHADCRGTREYNMELTNDRAQAAVDYLISKGVSPNRIKAKGYGEERPVFKCACDDNNYKTHCNDVEHQINRRTEFKIIEIGEPVLPKKTEPVPNLCK